MTRGMPERIKYDLRSHCGVKFTFPEEKRLYAENRHLASWIGGSMLASIKTFQDLSIKRAEYIDKEELRQKLINQRTL